MLHYRGLCLGFLLILLAAQPAWPQGIRRTPKNPPKFPQFNLSGTLDRIEVNELALTTAAGYTWILRPKSKVQVHLSGKATPEFLAPGQVIAFFAKLDTQSGTAIEEVRRLTVFIPNEKRPLGIQPDLGFGDLEKATFEELRQTKDAKRPDGTPQVSESESMSPSAAAPAVKQGKHASKKILPKNVDSFVVCGTIQSVKKGELVVLAPSDGFVKQNKLTVSIARDADITVDLIGPPALLVLVRPGDHVQASGDQTGEGRGDAKDLRIRVDRLLGAANDAKKPSETKGSASQHP
jgi:hypothetical protein